MRIDASPGKIPLPEYLAFEAVPAQLAPPIFMQSDVIAAAPVLNMGEVKQK
jgi:hypothetical protein